MRLCMRGSTDEECKAAFRAAKLKSIAFSQRNEVMNMDQVRSDLTDAGYPEATGEQLRLSTRLLRAMGVVITDQPRHLSEPLRPPPGFQALATAVAPAAVAATPDAVPTVVAVTLSDNQTDDAVPTAVAVPLSDNQTDDDVPRSRTTRSMTSRKYAVRPTNVKAVRPKKAQRPVPKTSPFVVTRTGLQTAGLYERVGADHPLLRELDQYMQKSSGCNSSQYRRGLANHVHRLHHFIQKTPENPTVLDVNAMMDPRKVEAS